MRFIDGVGRRRERFWFCHARCSTPAPRLTGCDPPDARVQVCDYGRANHQRPRMTKSPLVATHSMRVGHEIALNGAARLIVPRVQLGVAAPGLREVKAVPAPSMTAQNDPKAQETPVSPNGLTGVSSWRSVWVHAGADPVGSVVASTNPISFATTQRCVDGHEIVGTWVRRPGAAVSAETEGELGGCHVRRFRCASGAVEHDERAAVRIPGNDRAGATASHRFQIPLNEDPEYCQARPTDRSYLESVLSPEGPIQRRPMRSIIAQRRSETDHRHPQAHRPPALRCDATRLGLRQTTTKSPAYASSGSPVRRVVPPPRAELCAGAGRLAVNPLGGARLGTCRSATRAAGRRRSRSPGCPRPAGG